MRRRPIPALLFALAAVGCGEPVLDSKDLAGSIAELREEVEESRRIEFDAAAKLVRDAAAGEVPGTERFDLNGMNADAVLLEAQRIALRRERSVEADAAAANRALLAAEQVLARLRVVGFIPDQVSDQRMEADLTVRNELDFPVDTAWLLVEVAMPGAAALGGEEFLSFQPALRPGEERTVRMWVSGAAAPSLPAEPPAVARTRFVMVERGGEVVLKAASAEERQRAESAIADAEQRIADLDARLAKLAAPAG
jgi:hypothetical protein